MDWAEEIARKVWAGCIDDIAAELRQVVEKCKVEAVTVRDAYPPNSPQAFAAQCVMCAISVRFPEDGERFK